MPPHFPSFQDITGLQRAQFAMAALRKAGVRAMSSRRKADHEGADSRNRRPAVLSAGHSRRRRRYHRGRNRHQQAHALQPLPLQGRVDIGLSATPPLRAAPASDKPPVEQILGTFDRLERGFASKGFRGCPFVNAVAELGAEDRSVKKIAIAFKESRRLWFRDLLMQLDVADGRPCDPAHAAGRRLDRAGSGAQRSVDGAPRRKPRGCCWRMRGVDTATAAKKTRGSKKRASI